MSLGFCLTVLGAAVAAARPIALNHGSIEVEMTGAVAPPTAPPETIPVDGPWRLVQTLDGVRTWEAPLPARTRTLFFHRPPKGMELVRREDDEDSWGRARRVNHRPMGSPAPNSWSFDSDSLHIRRSVEAGPPPRGAYGMRFPEASAREAALRATASSSSSFAVRSLQVGDTTHHGLYLVPGMLLRTSVEVPGQGELRFRAMSVPPEAASPTVPRDGQRVSVTVVDEEGRRELLWSARPPDAVPTTARLDLSRWQGRTVQLEFAAPPDGEDFHDAVFLVDPVVLEPDPAPPRVVLIFVDTLRQDALSIYGNPRPTSPGIDQWAAEATIFTQARSVAPWTLPTARALFSGRAPELWGQTSDLPTILGQQGWATAFIAGNIYLSSNFDMANHWSTHRCINWPRAEVQMDRARQWLATQDDRPALLVLHFMDMHLPYTEPESFRDRFAGPTPELFGSDVFHRNQIVEWERDMEPADRDWVKARYHNNLAYIDSVLTPFLEALPSDATVVLVSDHGEEFWDHGEFEHGHSLYEELLRIPMIARGPGFPPGTTDAPTSILDITPTILRAAGIDAELEGVPLQDVAARPESFADRALAFGRPLYGQRRWGVVQNDRKYTTWKSTETVVDLRADPAEAHNLLPEAADTARWRDLLSEALRTPVHIAWSLYPQRSSRAPDLTIRVHSPSGIRHAWAAEDPTLMSAVATSVEDGTASLVWEGGMRGTREAYVVPNGDPLTGLLEATIEVEVEGATGTLPLPSTAPVLDGTNHVVGRVRVGGRSVTLQAAVVPLPPEEGIGITGYNKEVEAELEALGYLDH